MDHYKNIYSNHAETYHRMIAVEDVDNNLVQVMESLMPLTGKIVLDLGSGTGRIPLLLYKQAQQIWGFDLHWGMLCEQQRQRDQQNSTWGLIQGDLRVLPFLENLFDVITAGWAIGHFQDWYSSDWHVQVDQAINEMIRTLKPGGVMVIMETLTTGSTIPAPPTDRLASYYGRLEDHWGFTRLEISTDYQFRDLNEAVELTGFFFGDELAQKVRENNWVRLPEWTGVWWKQKDNKAYP
jgi:ubiquinone/menaquinone biosynthesis C-methylase UbiE